MGHHFGSAIVCAETVSGEKGGRHHAKSHLRLRHVSARIVRILSTDVSIIYPQTGFNNIAAPDFVIHKKCRPLQIGSPS